MCLMRGGDLGRIFFGSFYMPLGALSRDKEMNSPAVR